MLFYRIENENRLGPYAGVGTINSGISGTATTLHPLPQEDELLKFVIPTIHRGYYFSGKLRFGFSSLEQLRTWFNDVSDLGRLTEHGFHLSIYKVPKVYAGETQSVIEADYHIVENLKEKHNLDEIHLTTFQPVVE
jgi:hypothetical protein